MDPFGDDLTDAPPAENVSFDDPAADFLAREQEELGELGEELGLSNGHAGDTANHEEANGEADFFGGGDEPAFNEPATHLGDAMLNTSSPDLRSASTPSPQLFLSHPKPKEEPETIRHWRENYARLLQEKDAKENSQMQELRDQAKKELSDWYKHYDDQLNKTKETNRVSEKEFVAEANELKPGTEWDRVAKLCDFSSKTTTTKHSKDMSRMRSIMLQLKQNPPATKNAA